MITNPPHTRMTEFIVRGLALIDYTGRLAGFVLLSRQGHDVTLGRAAAFNRAAYEWRSCWRPWWKPRKKGDLSPRFTSQWTAWLHGYPGPPATWRVTRAEVRTPQLDLFD